MEVWVTNLLLGPRAVSSSRRHLATAEGGVGRVGIHLSERREDLGLVVEHVDVCLFVWIGWIGFEV